MKTNEEQKRSPNQSLVGETLVRSQTMNDVNKQFDGKRKSQASGEEAEMRS